MLVTRISPFSNKSLTLDLDITREQFWAWKDGLAAQRAFPDLSADEREFIITGIHPGEWEEYLGDEEM
jgi:hypothetical protein